MEMTRKLSMHAVVNVPLTCRNRAFLQPCFLGSSLFIPVCQHLNFSALRGANDSSASTTLLLVSAS
jgi:hypothetical protein